MEWLRVRNWERFQHYKDRNPPWIKLHVEIFTSADWVALADASKLLAVVCMVIAARHEGRVPNSPDYIKRVAYLDKKPNLNPLINCGFLEIVQADASALQADASALQADASALQADARPETETYREESEEERIIRQFDEFWSLVPRKVGKGQARKAYKTALKKTNPETMKAGIIRYACEVVEKDTEFIAHPATWLNGERWLDEPERKSHGNRNRGNEKDRPSPHDTMLAAHARAAATRPDPGEGADNDLGASGTGDAGGTAAGLPGIRGSGR